MEAFAIILAVVVVLAVAFFLTRKIFKKAGEEHSHPDDVETELVAADNSDLEKGVATELSLSFEGISALTESEENALVEIRDHELLARIDGVIPGALQAITNSGAAKQILTNGKGVGQLYKAIIPKGAELTRSRSMEGAVRGFFRGQNGIQGHANLVPVDGGTGAGLSTLNLANAAMGVASMVVGQYYMTQINHQIEEINSELGRIATFQDKEYQSRIYALVAEIQKCSTFQIEIIENEELRKRELDHLKDLEHECAQLLGQANLTLKDFKKRKNTKFDDYEKSVSQAQTWFQYQQILLEVMLKIEELTHALSLGQFSKENCYALFLPYARQADEAKVALKEWHEENSTQFELDIDGNRRRRQGIWRIIMAIPGRFNDDFHYKLVPQRTISMISRQSTVQSAPKSREVIDLFKEDVCLIAKDGKLYYLAEQSEQDQFVESV